MRFNLATVLTIEIFSFLSFLSCQQKPPSIMGDYELEEGFTLSFDEGTVTLRFVEVLADSRCPTGSNCGESGQAIVRFRLNNEGVLSLFELESDTDGKNVSQIETSFGSYEIKFIELYPYPVLNEPITEPYRLVFTLSQ